MTINYITYDSWWDTDITILPQLSKIASLRVLVLDPHKESKYPHKEARFPNRSATLFGDTQAVKL